MAQCTSIKPDGTQCSNSGRSFEGNCGIHHNSKLRSDPAYALRFQASQQQAREAQQREAEENERHLARERALQEERKLLRRQQKIEKNERYVNEAHLMSPNEILMYVRNLLQLWRNFVIHDPQYIFPRAYGLLKFRSSTHAGFPLLMRAVVRIVRQGFGHHPDHERYSDVPEAERNTAIQSLAEAVTLYGNNEEIAVLIPQADPVIGFVRERQRALLREQERLRQEQLQHDIQHNPVVFQRDPEGGIDLRAFSVDVQSVHRSSVQNATHKAVLALLNRPLVEGQDTLVEIIADFNKPTLVRFAKQEVKDKVVTELTTDYYNTEAFSLRYGDVLDHVWAFIRNHIHKKELVVRLAQEVAEGRRMCSNGKMARLVNVLQGFDDTLEMEAPKELFQNRIALLVNHTVEERRALAEALFQEFHIPEAERNAWLEPLLEA